MTGRGLPLVRLVDDRRGISAVEFALIAPALFAIIMGLSDLVYQAYVQSILTGAVQKAGRDSGLEGADATIIDGRVRSQVQAVSTSATVTPLRRSYTSFGTVAPERFSDANRNGARDPGECYDDVNDNKRWDEDPGRTGQGGASDVTLYEVTVTYQRLFPIAAAMGLGNSVRLRAQTLLKNQPYATQTIPTVKTLCN